MGAKKAINTVRRVAGALQNPISFAKKITAKKPKVVKKPRVKIEKKFKKTIKSRTQRNLESLGYK